MLKKQAPFDGVPPSGIFIRRKSGEAYYVKASIAHPVSEIHLQSWSAKPVLVTEMAFATLTIGKKIGFRDGTVVKDFADGIMYLISDSKRRKITSPDALAALGGKKASMLVPSEYILVHEEGEPLATLYVG
jgi:hypothetical protein